MTNLQTKTEQLKTLNTVHILYILYTFNINTFVCFVTAEQGIKSDPGTQISCHYSADPQQKCHHWKPATLVHVVDSNWKKRRWCDKLLYCLYSVLLLSSFPTLSPSIPSSFIQFLHLFLQQCPNVTVAIATQVLRPGSLPALPAVLEGILGYAVPKRFINRPINSLLVVARLSTQISQNNKQSCGYVFEPPPS